MKDHRFKIENNQSEAVGDGELSVGGIETKSNLYNFPIKTLLES